MKPNIFQVLRHLRQIVSLNPEFMVFFRALSELDRDIEEFDRDQTADILDAAGIVGSEDAADRIFKTLNGFPIIGRRIVGRHGRKTRYVFHVPTRELAELLLSQQDLEAEALASLQQLFANLLETLEENVAELDEDEGEEDISYHIDLDDGDAASIVSPRLLSDAEIQRLAHLVQSLPRAEQSRSRVDADQLLVPVLRMRQEIIVALRQGKSSTGAKFSNHIMASVDECVMGMYDLARPNSSDQERGRFSASLPKL